MRAAGRVFGFFRRFFDFADRNTVCPMENDFSYCLFGFAFAIRVFKAPCKERTERRRIERYDLGYRENAVFLTIDSAFASCNQRMYSGM